MKSTILILVISMLAFSCALEQASPSDYNDAFFREQMKIKDNINLLAKTTDLRRQEQIVKELKSQSVAALKRVEEIGAFRGDAQLFEASKRLFNFYHKMVHEGLDTEPESISKQLDNWRSQLSEEEHIFFRAQGKFAQTYDLFL